MHDFFVIIALNWQSMRSDLQNLPGHGQEGEALDEVRVGVFLVLVLEISEEHVHVQVLQLGNLFSIVNRGLKMISNVYFKPWSSGYGRRLMF